ncbi:hypothetical protein [Sorangium cellulosum]|uniref:hypothetical protein n=1 Tax=Sorangium cellulosum TaxID=56 RepID=UPI0002E28F90|nr:hypothetical protein [Sorangium cellulosum]
MISARTASRSLASRSAPRHAALERSSPPSQAAFTASTPARPWMRSSTTASSVEPGAAAASFA